MHPKRHVLLTRERVGMSHQSPPHVDGILVRAGGGGDGGSGGNPQGGLLLLFLRLLGPGLTSVEGVINRPFKIGALVRRQ